MSNFEYSRLGGNEGMIPAGTKIKTYTDTDGAQVQYVINISHNEQLTHEGQSYTVTDTRAINNTTAKWMLDTNGSGKEIHAIFTLTCSGEATYTLIEGADRSAGTPIPAVNRNRVSTNTSLVEFSYAPTDGTTDGNITLFTIHTGSTAQGANIGIEGSSQSPLEWILKPGTKYVITIQTYANVRATCGITWIEE